MKARSFNIVIPAQHLHFLATLEQRKNLSSHLYYFSFHGNLQVRKISIINNQNEFLRYIEIRTEYHFAS